MNFIKLTENRIHRVTALEADINSALDVSGGEGKLTLRGAKGLFEEVPGVEDGLNFGWDSSKGWQVLRDADAEGRVTEFCCLLVRIDSSGSIPGSPSVDSN